MLHPKMEVLASHFDHHQRERGNWNLKNESGYTETKWEGFTGISAQPSSMTHSSRNFIFCGLIQQKLVLLYCLKSGHLFYFSWLQDTFFIFLGSVLCTAKIFIGTNFQQTNEACKPSAHLRVCTLLLRFSMPSKHKLRH